MKPALFCLALCLLASAHSAETKTKNIQQEIRDRNCFLPLPLGVVKPREWAKVEIDRSAKGLGGLGVVNADGTLLLDNNNWLLAPPVEGVGPYCWWPYEQQGYFMDSAVRVALVSGNTTLLKKAEKTLDAVADRQHDNGYFFCKSDAWEKGWEEGDKGDDHYRWIETGFEGMDWSLAVFDRALLAAYESTKNPRYLEVLHKEFLHYDNKGRDPDRIGTEITGSELYYNRGLTIVESMGAYLHLTNDPAIYRKTVEIFKNNADGMVRNYLAGNYSTVCHGVTYNELTKLYVVGYLVTGRKDYLQAAVNARDYLVENNMLANGTPSGDEYFRGIGGFYATETCDVVDFSWAGLWYLRATGEARYADQVEEAFYNAGQRIAQPDFKTHTYYQAPNYVPGVAMEYEDERAPYKTCHQPLCCVRNLGRLLPNFIGHSTMRSKTGLAQIFYIPAEVQTTVDAQPVSYRVETDYPFGDRVTLRFLNPRPAKFALSLRVPHWCAFPRLEKNGKKLPAIPNAKGFIETRGEWKRGDRLTLYLPMKPRIETGRETQLLGEDGKPIHMTGHGGPLQVSSIKVGAPFLSIHRGPLCFSLPLEKREDANVAMLDNLCRLKVKAAPMPKGWCWEDPAPATIEAVAQSIDWKLVSGHPEMPTEPFFLDRKKTTETLTLVPYGSTDLYRLTMFPVLLQKTIRPPSR